ncbi:transglycosylase SLT domain-containing protein [bacterium]|nr:transglycosylase SLT domain-containing protein [bacterium]
MNFFKIMIIVTTQILCLSTSLISQNSLKGEAKNTPTSLVQDVTQNAVQDMDYNILSNFEFPPEVTFCDKRIPIEREYVQERMRIVIWKLARDPTILMIWKAKNAQFFPMAQKIYEEYGIPLDLLYHFDIESSWSPFSYSSAKARGVAQFIESTGRRFLDITSSRDDRRDIEKSIKASARYFIDLMDDIKKTYHILSEKEENPALREKFKRIASSSIKNFDCWEVVLAAYNSGQTFSVIKDQKITDFWDGFWSTQEALEHYPKVLAVKLIMEDPARYGLGFLANSKTFSPFEYDTIDGKIHKKLTFYDLATFSDSAFYEIKSLNIGYLIDYIPPGHISLKVPKGKKKIVLEHLKRNKYLNSEKPIPQNENVDDREFTRVIDGNDNYIKLAYDVKAGETIYQLIKKLKAMGYDVSTQEVISWNNLDKYGTIKPGQTLYFYINN